MHDQRTCPHCGGPFTVDSKYLGRKYCSAACAHAARKARGHVDRVCCTCGATFSAKRAEVARRGGKYCSRACWRANPSRVGSTPEHIARMKVERLGAGNPCYRGDNIGIAAAHDRVRAAKGHARDHLCVDCGGPALDWALSHDAEETFEAKTTAHGRFYSLDVDDYMPMCRRCHIHYDRDGVFERYFGANARFAA